MLDCFIVLSYKSCCCPSAEKSRLKSFKHLNALLKLCTLNSGATCALFRDSSKLKQKSTSASASRSTKFCSSEKDKKC